MAYVELHVRTNFSFLNGASHPEEYVRRSLELGHPAVAITDTNTLAGVVRAHSEAGTMRAEDPGRHGTGTRGRSTPGCAAH